MKRAGQSPSKLDIDTLELGYGTTNRLMGVDKVVLWVYIPVVAEPEPPKSIAGVVTYGQKVQ